LLKPYVCGSERDYCKLCWKGDVDLIVVGTRGRSGFSKKLLGSVALGVVTHAYCPVIVVK
jgi:nucleotide-binding universal stress UspA family protein